MEKTNLANYIKEQQDQRDKFALRVIESLHPKKLIVSGPGTGKTHTFKQLLKNKKGKCLALTFINNLADKLREDLKDSARSCTFHGFCKEQLHRINREGIDDDFILFPKLQLIIKSDAQTILHEDPNFARSFAQIDVKTENICFFMSRSNYYNAVSFDDSVYRVLEYFKKKPDEIPKFEQIVVDEYQDFNKLEVEFINILETKSPILIVGDDDQALYSQLKFASAEYIRKKFNDPNYEKFALPFCSRCPKVILDAFCDVISQAKRHGKLRERIDKNCTCYLPTKLSDSRKYPDIIHAHCSIQTKRYPFIAKFIEREIGELGPNQIKKANEQSDYTVLITGPKEYLEQIHPYLESRGDYLLSFRKLDPEQKKIKTLDGYKILLDENRFSNLGWRILLHCDPIEGIDGLLKNTIQNDKIRIFDCLPESYVKKHEARMSALQKLVKNEGIAQSQKKELREFLGVGVEFLSTKPQKDVGTENKENGEVLASDRISVTLATYLGCKGLSAGYVFVIGLNEGKLPRYNTKPSDIEICQFIVALTRTTRKCYLISVSSFGGNPAGRWSIFINWINKNRVKYQYVDINYWKSM